MDYITIPLKGGYTNNVFKLISNNLSQPPVIQKIYGASSDFINHNDEIDIINKLKEDPTTIGIITIDILQSYKDSRIEKFIYGRSLTTREISNPSYLKHIAYKMGRMHALDISNNSPHKTIFHKLRKMLKKLDVSISTDILHYVNTLENIAITKQYTLGFCHNDLLAGNIMQTSNPYIIDHESNICFIDLEYACQNYRGYDIANFYNEMCGIECDQDKYPSDDVQSTFIKYYQLGNERRFPPPSSEEIRFFSLVSHLFWGAWALLQINTGKFNCQKYAEKRLLLARRLLYEIPQKLDV